MNVHYFKELWKSSLMILMLCFGLTSLWGQTTVNFDNEANWTNSGTITSYGSHSYSQNGLSANLTKGLRNTNSSQDGYPGALGTYSIRLQNAVNAQALFTIATGGVGEFSFKVRRWDESPMPDYTVEYSINYGVNWTSVTNIDGTLLTNSDWKTYGPITVNSDNDNIQIRVKNTGTTERIMIDDFNWTGYSAGPPTQVATPTFMVTGEANGVDTYWNTASITLETTTGGATIYYTTDGSEPTTASTEYTVAFDVTATTTIKAFAVADGLDDSEIATKTITITHTVPTITVSTTNLTGLGYEFGSSTSTAQSFNLIGANLDESEYVYIILDEGETSNFEISLDDVSYNYELEIPAFNNGSIPIYVRLKSGLAISEDYLDLITIMDDINTSDIDIMVEGVVTPPASTTTVSETTLSGFTYVLGNGPSDEQSFTVEGSYLTSDITVTAPTNYQVSLSSGSGFQNSVTLTQTDGTVAETTVYVQLNAGLGVNNYNGDITVTATDVANKTIALTGSVTCGASALPYSEDFESVTTPNVPNCTTVVQGGSGNLWTTSSPNESGFTSKALTYQWHNDNDGDTWFFTNGLELEGGQSYRLSFRYGNNSTSYSESLRVAYGTSNSIAAMTTELADYPNINDNTPHSVTINFEPATTGTYYIGFQAYSEPDNYRLYVDDILVEENVPTISVEPVTVPAFTAVTDGSDSEDIIITGILLSDNIDIALSGINADQFSLSATSLDSAGGTLTVTYEPTTVGNHTATLTLSSTDATDVVLTLNGIATIGVPVATATTNTTSNSFTANWEAVTGAESYEIDVYTMSGESSITESFTSTTFPPTGWTSQGWTRSTTSADYNTGPAAAVASGQNGYLTTNAISNPTSLKFYLGRSTNSTAKTLEVQISTVSQTTDFSTVATFNHSNVPSGSYNQYTVDLSDYENEEEVYIRFTKTSSTASPWRLDDIEVSLLNRDYTLEAENVGNVTSFNVEDLDPETTYYYVVRAVAGAETSVNSNEIEVETLAAATAIVWTTEGGWSNITGPTIADDAIIEGDLTLAENVSALTLTVASGGKITVPENIVLTVEGKITNNGDFTVENDGILYQNNFTGANEGAITVKRNSNPMFRLDYTLWSSPVAMNLVDFSEVSATSPTAGTGTLWNRVYTLGSAAWEQVWATQPDVNNDTTPFVAGQGYLYRSPNLWVIRGNEDGDPAEAYEGIFTGVPNNGNVTIDTDFTFNALGNPYPSPLYADDFIDGNTGAEFLYFWTNVNPPVDGSYDGINNWAYYSKTMGGGTGVDGQFEPAANMLIQPGQGFVVSVTAGTEDVTFTNNMRRTSNGDFFRQMSNERHRFWLNLSNEEVVFNQILVGYVDNATQGVDTGIDAKMFAYEGNALYSIIENSDENYVIQGRSLPFTASDVVALGFRAVNTGSFTISLHNFDGLFADNQNIYLKDNFTQAVHNLKDGAYTFVSEEGVFNTRFEVVYQTTMSVENPVANNANWVVYSQENGFQVQTQGFELKTVQVYDLLGRTIYTANAQGTAHNIPSLGADSVYIVKVTTTENVVLSKKVK